MTPPRILPDLPFGLGGATAPPAEHPDLGEGMGQARDEALDAEALATTNVRELPAAGQSASEAEAYAALGAARGPVLECAHGVLLDADCADCNAPPLPADAIRRAEAAAASARDDKPRGEG